MLRYQKLLIVLSLLFAMIATIVGYKIVMIKAENIQVDKVLIPVAKEDIPPMTKITSEHIVLLNVSNSFEELNILKNQSQIIGQYSLVQINKNSPFIQSNLLIQESLNPFLLPKGYRAITIQDSPLIGVGGFLEAGMFVDVTWTYKEGNDFNTVIAFQNVKVLAVGGPNQLLSDKNNNNTITLMLSIEEAQRITYMESKGELKLLLRPSPTEDINQLSPIDSTNIMKR